MPIDDRGITGRKVPSARENTGNGIRWEGPNSGFPDARTLRETGKRRRTPPETESRPNRTARRILTNAGRMGGCRTRMLKRNSVVTRQSFPATIAAGRGKSEIGPLPPSQDVGTMASCWAGCGSMAHSLGLIASSVFMTVRLCTPIMRVFGQVAGFEGR